MSMITENSRKILASLEKYNEDELFYKHCYELKDDARALSEFILALGEKEFEKRSLIDPHLNRMSGKKLKLEEDGELFRRLNPKNDRNIILYKHNRYTPFFVHPHGFFEIFYVLTGQCTNTMNDKRIHMPQGNLCFIAINVEHAIEVFDDSIIINILIRKSTFDAILFNLLITNDILAEFFLGNLFFVHPLEYIIFDIGNDTEMMEQFFAMLAEQSQCDEHSDRIMTNRISIFFSLLVRKYGKAGRIPLAPDQSTANKKRHRNMISYIYDNFQTVTLSKIAKHFNLSLSHCSRLIESATGKTYTTLIRDLRMKHAEVLLSSSNTRINDISYALGYENQETFFRAFKKLYDMTPTEYRHKSQKA